MAGKSPLQRIRRWIMQSGSERSACRALLRLTREIDADPDRISVLLGRPPRLFNPDSNSVLHKPPGQFPFVDDTLCTVAGGATEFAAPSGECTRAVRSHIMRAKTLGLPLEVELKELGRRLEAARAVAMHLEVVAGTHQEIEAKGHATSGRGDDEASTAAASSSSSSSSSPSASSSPSSSSSSSSSSAPACPDNGAETKVLHEAWLQPGALRRIPPMRKNDLKVGDLLITHPLAGLFQAVFDNAVLLVTHVSGQSVRAIVVNGFEASHQERSTKLADVLAVAGSDEWMEISPDRRQFAPETITPFLADPVYEGGPVLAGTLSQDLVWLHKHPDLVESQFKLTPTVCLGGALSIVARAAAERRANGEDPGLRFVYGCATWTTPQLEIEIERGVWIHARSAGGVREEASASSCSTDLSEPTPSTSEPTGSSSSSASPSSSSSSSSCSSSSSPTSGAPPVGNPLEALIFSEFDRETTWRSALLGASLPSLAFMPRGKGVDGFLRHILDAHHDVCSHELLSLGRGPNGPNRPQR